MRGSTGEVLPLAFFSGTTMSEPITAIELAKLCDRAFKMLRDARNMVNEAEFILVREAFRHELRQDFNAFKRTMLAFEHLFLAKMRDGEPMLDMADRILALRAERDGLMKRTAELEAERDKLVDELVARKGSPDAT